MIRQLIQRVGRQMRRNGMSPVPVQIGPLPVSYAVSAGPPRIVLSWVHVLRSCMNPEHTRRVLLHEQGHHIYWTLPSRARQRAEKLFGVSTPLQFWRYLRYAVKHKAREGHISAYAMVSADEDFAETFAHVMCGGRVTGDLIVDRKIAFVRGVIRAKRE